MGGTRRPPPTTGATSGSSISPPPPRTTSIPRSPARHVDLIYLCYPNNPTGAVLGKDALKRWVDYARREGAVILYDAAYESYIRDPAIPARSTRSRARRKSPSSSARSQDGGLHRRPLCHTPWCPRPAWARSASGEAVSLHALWFRRQSTKFNGVSYIVQKGAAAAVLAGRPEAGARVGGLLPGECPHHPRGWRPSGSPCTGDQCPISG